MNRKCPICGMTYVEHPAISRRDNKTEICPNCGMVEALEDMMNFMEDDRDEDSEDM